MSIFGPELAENPAWPSLLPSVLSPSSLTTYLTCQEQWRRVYINGERSRSSGALLIGRADSKAREVDLGQKITSGVNLPLADVQYAAAESFDQELDAEGGAGEVEWKDDKPGEARDMAVSVASAYRTQLSERVQPVAVEREVRLDLPDLPPIRGYLDVEEGRTNRECKTSNRRVSKPSGGWKVQTLLYSAATGKPTEFDVTTKNKAPEVISGMNDPAFVVHENTFKAAAQLEQVLTTVSQSVLGNLEKIGPERPWPGANVQLAPPCSWCQFAASCPWVT